MTEEEFDFRKKKRDPFIISILSGSRVMLIGRRGSNAFMRKSPRYLLWLIIGLTVLAVFINLPKVSNIRFANKTFSFDPNSIFAALKINKVFNFREGLDLKGGTSLVLKANMSNIASAQRTQL